MSNFNLYHQYNYNPMLQNGANPYFAQNAIPYNPNMQGTIPAMQGVNYDDLRTHVETKSKDNVIAQATKDYDVMEHPGVLLKNLLLCIAMSAGFTAGTNWLMSSKKTAENALQTSNIADFEKTRLYKAGTYLDKSAVGKFFAKVSNGVKSGVSKIPVPAFLKEIGGKIKVGGIAVLDKQGMYSLGKGAEALNEAVEFLSRVPVKEIKELGLGKNEAEVLKVLKEFKLGKLRGPVAYQKIAHYFDAVPAEKLSKLTVGAASKIDKVLTTTPNINLALNKARFFNGIYNKSQGPLAKAMQKFTALVGEASGGGVLGGKMALLMNSVGLMTGFNAASNAEKGDKLKAFMEDYIGFTLGSYLMSFFVGTWFNKFLGVSEFGMDKNAVAAVGKRLGIDMTQGRLQDAVIAYNKEFKQVRDLNKLAQDFRNGNVTFAKAVSKAQKLNVEGAKKAKSSIELLNEIEKVTRGKNEAYYASLRKDIKGAMKSKLTLKSVFKGSEHNSGGFLTRLGRYVVQKPLSILGRAMSVGRYDLVSGTKFAPKSILKFAKRFGGGLGRALFVMFVLVEPFRKGFMKLSHMIFGKPKKSALDDYKTPEEKKETEQVQEAAKQNALAQQTPAINNEKVDYSKQKYADTNIFNQMMQNPNKGSVSAASPINDTMNAEELNRDNVPELVRTYVPSPMPSAAALARDPRELEVEKALLKADAAEKAAMNFLH